MSKPDRIAIIINPISGTGGRPEVARRRAEMAAALTASRNVDAEIFVTTHPGHARELTQAALARGITLVVGWGGDGTLNEIASVLAFRDAALAVVPSGSGNGLARELGIPFDASRALDVALNGRERVIDCGELDGHLFFNIAGLGLDARVAHQFAANGLVRRGFSRYLEITVRELFRFEPDDHTIVADGVSTHARALLVAIANSRQYGNGAIIAPHARVDDGRLDVIVVGHRSPWQVLRYMPRLFSGQIDRVPDVMATTAMRIEVTSAHPVIYHVDGEPYVGAASVHARVHPQALRVRVASLDNGRAISVDT